MTNEDLILHITALRTCERVEMERIRVQSKKDQQKMLDRWANEHARFKIGDIICSNSTTIRVEQIIGRLCQNTPYIEYKGHVLTKKLKDRADGWFTTIFDDTPERNIVKVK